MNLRKVYIVQDNTIVNATLEMENEPLEDNKVVHDPYNAVYEIGYVKVGDSFYPPGVTDTQINEQTALLEAEISNNLSVINNFIASEDYNSLSDDSKAACQAHKDYLTSFQITNPFAQRVVHFDLPNS